MIRAVNPFTGKIPSQATTNQIRAIVTKAAGASYSLTAFPIENIKCKFCNCGEKLVIWDRHSGFNDQS